jgi:hypothetical protein
MNNTNPPSDDFQDESTGYSRSISSKIDAYKAEIADLEKTRNDDINNLDELRKKIRKVKGKKSKVSFDLEVINDFDPELVQHRKPKIDTATRLTEIGINICLSLGGFATLLELSTIDPAITSISSLLQLAFLFVISYGIVFALKAGIVKHITTAEKISLYHRLDNKTNKFTRNKSHSEDGQSFNVDSEMPPLDRAEQDSLVDSENKSLLEVEQDFDVDSAIEIKLRTQSLARLFHDRRVLWNVGILTVLDFGFAASGVWFSFPSGTNLAIRLISLIPVFLFSYLNILNALAMASHEILQDIKRNEKIKVLKEDTEKIVRTLLDKSHKLKLKLDDLEDKHEELLDRLDDLDDRIAELEERKLEAIDELESNNDGWAAA